MSRQRNLTAILGLFGFFGTIAWGLYTFALRHEAGPDWMVFYSAARAYLDGNLSLIFDGERFTDALNARFADWLATPLVFLPWVNPPNFLLFILPFGLLPFGFAYALFEAFNFAALLAALRLWAKERARWRLFAFALAFCPATAFTIFVGQSSFLTAALLLGGFALLTRRPIVAGMLFGILGYKPQFCLMIPIALLAERQGRAMLSAAATVVALVGVSALLFGIEPWRQWFDFVRGASELYQHWAATARFTEQSVYACVLLLGGSAVTANLTQMVAMIFAGCSVYWCYRRPMRRDLRLAVLLTASLLAAPHVSTADGLLAPVAAMLLLGVALDEGFQPADTPLIILMWLCPLASPPGFLGIGLAIPLLLAFFIAWIARRDAGVPIAARPAPRVV